MIKHTVINAELGYALATARHKDAIVICDANMPIPDGCNVIDRLSRAGSSDAGADDVRDPE